MLQLGQGQTQSCLKCHPGYLSVKCDLGAFLAHIYILEESAISIVGLLFDSRPKFQQLVWDRLLRGLEDVDQSVGSKPSLPRIRNEKADLRPGMRLVMLSEKRDSAARFARSPSASNAVDVVLDGQGKLQPRLSISDPK